MCVGFTKRSEREIHQQIKANRKRTLLQAKLAKKKRIKARNGQMTLRKVRNVFKKAHWTYFYFTGASGNRQEHMIETGGIQLFFKILTSKKGHVFGPISSIKMSLMFRLPGICAFNLYGLLIKKKINFILFHFPGKQQKASGFGGGGAF